MDDSTVYKQNDAGVFIQFRPGDKTYYLGDCIDLDKIPNPRVGGMNLIQCWNGRRTGFVTKGKSYTAPGNIEIKLTDMLGKTANWLEQVQCPFTLYALKRSCGEAGLFTNWERGAIVSDVTISADDLTGFADHVGAKETLFEYTLLASPPRVDVRLWAASAETDAETAMATCLAFSGALACDDACGAYNLPCDNIYVGCDHAGAASAKVQHSHDNGTTWAATAADPFAINLEIVSVACFEISPGVNRLLALRETLAATPLQCNYSDDGGTTWHGAINIGSTVTEAGTGPKSLFALDREHIWCVTDKGNVYFSNDGGDTWTDQGALGASGAASLNAIHGCDENNLVAVGAGDVIIYTHDGGIHWVAGTATGTGNNFLSVFVFSQYRALIGGAIPGAGEHALYMTYNSCLTWSPRDFTGYTLEEVTDMDFATDSVGIIITNTAGPVGSIHQTIDGGYSWKEITAPANSGLNAVKMCGVNEAFAVGHIHSATAEIEHISG